MRTLFIILFSLITLLSAHGQTKREVRAVWLTTAYGLDWPKSAATTDAGIHRQKQALCNILDSLKSANFNTVLFQTRLRGDVLYPSAIEPFNEILTGKEGKEPGYDPLAFAIEECHKRGLEFHAWVVSMPLGTRKHVASLGSKSVTKKKPAICKQYKGEWFLNPGMPETKEYLFSIVKEIVTRYDVDGIHLDYIRYPDHPKNFPDADTYRKYGAKKELSQWRRDNITAIVRHIYNGVKVLKPWVKVSSSPLGKYKDTSRYPSGGWNGYHAVFQDAQGWLKEGIQDMIFPMMYFIGNNFYPFALDWQEKCYGRQIIPGLGIYFLHPSERDWPLGEIEREIYFIRDHHLAGQAYYRMEFLQNNTKGIMDMLKQKFYRTPAIPPAISWMDSMPPSIPQALTCVRESGNVYLNWQASTDNDTQNRPTYIVYASNRYPVDTEKAGNIVAAQIKGTTYVCADTKRYYAVTAIDRYGNESSASQLPPPPQRQKQKVDADYICITDAIGAPLLSEPYTGTLPMDKLNESIYKVIYLKDGRIVKEEVIYTNQH